MPDRAVEDKIHTGSCKLKARDSNQGRCFLDVYEEDSEEDFSSPVIHQVEPNRFE
jgi:hypothetical protein